MIDMFQEVWVSVGLVSVSVISLVSVWVDFSMGILFCLFIVVM